MGISQIPAPSTSVSPSSATRPIFTLANTYDLSGTITTSLTNMITDMVYIRSTGKLGFSIASSTSTNAWATWTPGGTSVTRYNLPVSVQNEGFKFEVGGAGRLWYVTGMDDDTTRTIYHSSNEGSTWTNYASITSGANDIFPISSNLKPDLNPNDELEIGVTGQSIKQFFNLTSGAYSWTFSVADTSPTQANGTYNKIIAMKSGDDSGIVTGYHHRFGSRYSDTSSNAKGSTGTSIFSLYDSRAGGNMHFVKAEPEFISASSKDGWQDQIAGRATCIENRWIHFSSRYSLGSAIYDTQTQKFMGGIQSMAHISNGSSRIVYLSSTKKAYWYSGQTKKMYEYDVTFI